MQKSNASVLGRVHSYTLKDMKAASRGGRRLISGYANTATVDRGFEVVEPNAFKSSLDKYMENPIVFYNHDWDEAIGKVVEAKILPTGLFVEIEIAKGYDTADKVWAQIEQGVLKAFSIGFRPIVLEFDEEHEILTIKDMELYEVSVVTIPMNRESLFDITEDRVTGIKVMDSGNFVNYKSIKGVTQEKTVADKVTVELDLDTSKFESRINELSEKVLELQDELSAVESSEAFDSTIHEEQLELALEEVKGLTEQLTTIEDKLKEAESKYSNLEDENYRLKAKILMESINFSDLAKSVIQ